MKTGIELIAKERQEQIEKHGRTVKYDVNTNYDGQLRRGAVSLIGYIDGSSDFLMMPGDWDRNLCTVMCQKSYQERLIIAGALIAAEIDRIIADDESK